jgi:hypothetical protein
MAKDVSFRLVPVALVVVGWLSFVAGQLLQLAPLHKLILLGAARVLPRSFEPEPRCPVVASAPLNRPLHPTGTAPPPPGVWSPRCGARGRALGR